MNVILPKVIRFISNVIIYSSILIAVTYYSYTNVPEFFALKNLMIPFTGTIILAIIISVLLAGINEITTLFVVRFYRGKSR